MEILEHRRKRNDKVPDLQVPREPFEANLDAIITQ